MRFWWCAKLCAKARDVEARLKVKIPVEIATTKNLVVFMSFSPFLFVSAYILLYNVIIAKKEGVIMLKKYFSKYKWTDLFWILFVVLTCIYVGNRDLLPLNHQEFSLRGSFWGFVLALYHLLFIDKFVISNRK